MQTTEAYLELLQERGKRGLPVERLYRQLYNHNLYLSAYGKIYRNAGAMTPGVTKETPDGMSIGNIEAVIEALRYERYHWKPARRTYVLKKNGKKRPLGLPTWSDKLLAEVMRLILSAYYEPQFSEHSHGFRPQRGCHTALRDIYYNWRGVIWIIEGDIADCFGSLSHELLIETLQEKIHDGRFINLIQMLLDAGYMENWRLRQTLSGVPQGSILSPILSNILLDKLDTFVETVLVPQYTRGERKKPNREYTNTLSRARRLYNIGQKEAAHQLRRQAQRLPSIDTHDSDYRRLYYCRYADDFILGFIGSKEEAEAIKQQLRTFLREELKLELSEEKTLITHAKSGAARFLGYEVTTLQSDTKHVLDRAHNKRRSINGKIGIRVPRTILFEKCNRYRKHEKVVHRAELLNESDYTIISMYQLEYRGIVEYYRLAYNMHTLSLLRWTMEISLTKTLARKYKTTVSKIYDKYEVDIHVNGVVYKGLQVSVSRDGKKPLVATWGGVPLIWNIQADVEDRPQRRWNRRSELEKRLLAQVCEACGATRLTERIEVHHIRALKDLNKYTGREKPGWVHIMAARKRKTLVLCHTCHVHLHAGRPLRQKVLHS